MPSPSKVSGSDPHFSLVTLRMAQTRTADLIGQTRMAGLIGQCDSGEQKRTVDLIQLEK